MTWLKTHAFKFGGAIILLIVIVGFALQTYAAINTNKVVNQQQQNHSSAYKDYQAICSSIPHCKLPPPSK